MTASPPIQSSAHQQLLDNLLGVFSARGFDGASLAELARASGRSKASLYHHFPGGKAQMIEVLLARCVADLDSAAFAPLRESADQEWPEQIRAAQALDACIDGFNGYIEANEGHCLLATLALTQPELLGEAQITQTANWHNSLAQCCEHTGRKPKAARRLAHAILSQLYGSLTLAAMGSGISVNRATKWLKKSLKKELRSTALD